MGGPPPPPFGGFAPHGPPQPKAKPLNLSSKPLKSFNWQKLPAAKIKDTVWSSIDDEEIHKSLKGKVYSEFENLFAAKEIKSEAQQSNVDITPKDITFLDSKRSQNCNIMLKAIKLDARSIKRAINEVDTTTLPRHILVELLKFIPTEEEMIALKAVDSADIKNLAFAVFKDLLRIGKLYA
jgi:hypothetical protein